MAETVTQPILDWLLAGDVSIQYQTHRDLMDTDRPDLRKRIATEGWGKRYLDQRNPDGSWGREFYFPKWISTHYTLLELKRLGLARDNPAVRESIDKVLEEYKVPDGAIGCSRQAKRSDVCVNGMFLNYASYFGAAEGRLRSVVDFLLNEHMGDGGFNCESNGRGARHSSLHSTLSVMEGILEFERNGYGYRLEELQLAAQQATEFILMHRFFRSDRTGEVINPQFLSFRYPSRWFYNILRALDHFRDAGLPYDERMNDALEVIDGKRGSDGRWRRVRGPSGQEFFELEPPGPGRINTLMALRVLRKYRTQ